MNRLLLSFGFVIASAAGIGQAVAQPLPQRHVVRSAVAADRWSFLGETHVGGYRDRDVLELGRGSRHIDRLILVARERSTGVRVVRVGYADGQSFVVNVNATLPRGGRTPAIDLPRNGRLSTIEVFGDGRRRAGRVEVWGEVEGYAVRPAPRPSYSETLGVAFVSGRIDRETIAVGAHEGRFRQLVLRTSDADVRIRNVVVTFANGQTVAMPVSAYHGSEQVLDLPGDARAIRSVSFSAWQSGFARPARVEIIGIS